jgi:hypothetical protein
MALVSLCALVWALMLACGPAWGAFTHPFVGSFGSFSNVQGVAVNQASGDVYVYDGRAGAVYKFDAAGAPVDFSATATNAIVGVPRASSAEGEIAVDSSSGPAKGDIYVAHTESSVLVYDEAGEKVGELTEVAGRPWGEVCGVAVDPSGNVYVGLYPGTVDRYAPAANPVVNGDYTGSLYGVQKVCNIAADATGATYVDSWERGPVTKYEALQFNVLETTASGIEVSQSGSTLAVDPSNGDLYVDSLNEVAEFEPGGGALGGFGSSGPGALNGSSYSSYGIAVNGATHEVYVSDGAGHITIFGPRVLVPGVSTGPAAGITDGAATVSGSVNPEGVPVTSCEVEYGPSASYGQSAPCAQTPAEIGSGSAPVAVEARLTGLQPLTLYHYRLVAGNVNAVSYGEDRTFTTLSPPTVAEESVIEVTSNSATLQASLNPNGLDTTYRVEYGTSASYGASAPAGERDVGSGLTGVSVSVPVQGLQPSTTYHYRFVATNAVKAADGPDRTFTTQGPGGTLALPDGRAWELVSPAQKLGAQVIPESNALIQASEDGSAISYYLTAPFLESQAGNVRLTQAISRRGPDGWSTEDVATPYTRPSSVSESHDEYQFFSSDLSRGLVVPFGVEPAPLPPFSGETVEGTVYLRNDDECEPTPREAIPATCYLHLGARLVTATPDLSHVVLRCGSEYSEYCEWSEGEVRTVPEPGFENNLRRAISNDGSRIAGGPGYQIASSDGSLVFRTGAEHGLYVENMETGKSQPITVPLNSGEDPGVEGLVLGASEDGSYVYLVARGVLSEAASSEREKAVAGGDNLYVLHRETHGSTETWTPSFIATLSAGDIPDWEPEHFEPYNFYPGTQTEEVSPDGRYLAFMSDRSLTGYDNRDASSGEPDEEVYRYDAATARLVCASCNPTGARPAGWQLSGSSIAEPASHEGSWSGRWVAATIPGMTEVGKREGLGTGFDDAAFYEPRYMLDSGQLFFDSHDALVPQAVNGVGDVYEYESGGTGSCPAGSDGCVALLSGGTGTEESAFEDASANGSDVFFVTAEKLVSQDLGNEYNMYDAHVCSATSPCPSTATVPPPCDSADSCKPAQALQPGVFGPSGSATFSGPGNPAPPSVAASKSATRKAAKCRRGSVRERGRCVKSRRGKRKSKATRTSESRRAE